MVGEGWGGVLGERLEWWVRDGMGCWVLGERLEE